jgi:hypothetical protein
MCPFAAACFANWEPEPAVDITDPDTLEVVARLAAIKQQEAEHNAVLRSLEEGKEEAQAALAELLTEPESRVGPFLVKRTDVQRKPTFSMRAAEAAGFPIHTLDEFMRVGSAYTTWRITRAEEAGEMDFGGVPF